MLSEDYKDCLSYIDSYWDRIIRKPTQKSFSTRIITAPYDLLRLHDEKKKLFQIALPHPYFVPNDRKFDYIFYWDSFFMFRGLMGTKRAGIMRSQVDNFLFLFEKYQIIPNFNAPAGMGRSQPPFLTSMILDTYTTRLEKKRNHLSELRRELYKTRSRNWLERAFHIAKDEYEKVWIDTECVYNHSVDRQYLARYGDRDIGYAHSSELESGWDMTSRFYNRCDQFLPVDLNTYLYKYELDFSQIAAMLGESREEMYWKERAKKRQKQMQELMWDDKTGFFYDYGYAYKKQSSFFSLAGFVPLWAGLATPEQAEKAVKHLPKFETPYGLTITAKESLARPIDLSGIQKRYHPAINDVIQPKQWDYPNIWSPLEYLTIVGLLRYGYKEEARRIMIGAVETHAKLYRKHKMFFEKINGETGDASTSYLYESQLGFGWTNAIFYRYIQILDYLNTNQELYKNPNRPAPFDLLIAS